MSSYLTDTAINCTRYGSSTAGLRDHGRNYKNGSANPATLPSNKKIKMLPLMISTSSLTYVLTGACSTTSTLSRLLLKQPLSANNTTSSCES